MVALVVAGLRSIEAPPPTKLLAATTALLTTEPSEATTFNATVMPSAFGSRFRARSWGKAAARSKVPKSTLIGNGEPTGTDPSAVIDTGIV